MRVALVHDWLTGMRGGEKVLSLLCGLWPGADLYTLIHAPGTCDRTIERMNIRTSWLNDLPGVRHYYRYLLGIMPLAAECLDLTGYDLVISCSHCVAKGVQVSPRALHVCYCFSPMRYVWGQDSAYRRAMGPAGLALAGMKGYLKAWDRRSACKVDAFIANSRYIADRIRMAYGRTADVVHSPIDVDFYTPGDMPREDFYLMVGALAPYKRADHAAEAFARSGRRLKIIGSGQQLRALRRRATGNVELLGYRDDVTIRDHYRRCRALVFPGEEDFGLVPLEAMACGAPVIAYGAGGAVETIRDIRADAPTGLLYTPQTPDGLADAVERFERVDQVFDPEALRRWAVRFSPERFLDQVREVLARQGVELQ